MHHKGRYDTYSGRQGSLLILQQGVAKLLEPLQWRMMATEIATGELLELRTEAGGLRYYLAGKPIHAGELRDLLLDDGSWALGRFEWNYRKEELPWLYVDTETGDAIELDPEKFRLRWPEGER